eukprot:2613056-Prymnesium_polylepis.2
MCLKPLKRLLHLLGSGVRGASPDPPRHTGTSTQGQAIPQIGAPTQSGVACCLQDARIRTCVLRAATIRGAAHRSRDPARYALARAALWPVAVRLRRPRRWLQRRWSRRRHSPAAPLA